MPKKGERQTVGGVTGEWDGTDWREVLPEVPSREASMTISADPAAPAGGGGPKKGDRKTVGGITGEFDGTDWREVVPDTPAGPPKNPKSILGFLGNAVTSTGRLVGDTVMGAGGIVKAGLEATAHPDEYAAKLLTNPAVMAAAKDPLGTAGKVGGAAKDYFGKRYGGVQNVLDTAYEDPAGVAADLSTVLTLGGSAGARAPGLAGRIARGAAAAGSAIDPIANVGRAGHLAATPVRQGMESAGVWLNKRAFPVPKHITARNPTVDFPRELAEQGITRSVGGRDLNRSRIAPDEALLDEIGARSTATTTVVPITSELRSMAASKRGLVKGGALADEAGSVDEKVQRLLRENTVTPPAPVPGPLASSAGYASAPGAASATAPPGVPPLVPAQGALRAPAPPPPRPSVGYTAPAPGAWGTAPATPPPPAVGWPAAAAGAPPAVPPAQGALPISAPAAAGAPTPVGGFTPYGPFEDIPFQTVQANKVALNQRLQNSFGAGVTPLETDILHGERKGMMHAAELMEPGVKPINERLGPRYAIDDALSDLIAADEKALPAATLWGSIKSPWLRSVLAKELFRVGKVGAPVAAALEQAGPTMTRAALMERLAEASQDRGR